MPEIPRTRHAAAGLCAFVVAATVASGPAVPAMRAAAPAPPKLVVVVSVDGLSWPNLIRYRSRFRAGLRQILDEGFAFTQAHYAHINTETSPGHASLAVGAPPRVTGIVANRWLSRGPDGAIRSVYSTQMFVPPAVPGDPPLFYREVPKDGRLYVFAFAREFELWSSSGETGRAIQRLGEGPRGQTVVFDSEDAIALFNQKYGRPAEALPARAILTGPGNLKADTLGDRLLVAMPEARVVSISGKDRTSIMLAGRNTRHLAYWYDRDAGRFTTSAYYDTYAPAGAAGRDLVARFNREMAGSVLPTRFGTEWRPLPVEGAEPPPSPEAASPQPAALLADFQVPVNGLGFPHNLAFGARGYFTGFYYSPFVDELVMDLALSFLADDRLSLGRGRASDVLYIGLSAQDTVSHSYGPESAEGLDVLRRVDVQLGRLFEALSARGLTRDDVVVALSADHGFADIPEVARRHDTGVEGGRLVESESVRPSFYQRLNRLLSETLCLPEGSRPVYGGEGWSLTYNHPLLPMRTVAGTCGEAGRPVGPADIDRALPGVILQHYREEVDRVLLVSRRTAWPAGDPIVGFVNNDFDPERSGDAFVVPKAGVLMHDDPGRGTGHGTHHAYDTHVPLAFWGRAWRAGQSDTPATPYDMAPTLAAALGISLPDATGRNLSATATAAAHAR